MKTVDLSSVVARRRSARGFTLIELMIVVAIVGILARIAYPAYVDYIRRGDLAEAFQTLSSTQVKMEQYYQDNRSYVSSGTTCGVALTNTTYFTYACTGSATTFTVTASGVAGKPTSGDEYTINQLGTKGTTKLKGASVNLSNCWAKKSSTDC